MNMKNTLSTISQKDEQYENALKALDDYRKISLEIMETNVKIETQLLVAFAGDVMVYEACARKFEEMAECL